MIVNESKHHFTLIEQDHHASISTEIIKNWQNTFLNDDPFKDSVLYAIRHHDCGWTYFDKQPFWNDEKLAPFSFIDFPTLPKLILYTDGVNQVEQKDPYAAALCSAHYTSFLKKHSSSEVKNYLHDEKKRRKRIFNSVLNVSSEHFHKHLAILQFADNISLYLCLNEPGISKQDEHSFFKNGIPISQMINQITTNFVQANWVDNQTVTLRGLPNVKPFQVILQRKIIAKEKINQVGLLNSYQNSTYENIVINLKVK